MTEMQLLLICNALTPSATKVLTAFMMAGIALDIDGLIKWTRMGRHSIYSALKQLHEYGLVVKQVMAHNRVIWMLTTNIFPELRNVPSGQLEANPPTGSNVVVIDDSPYLKESVNNNNKSQLEANPPTGKSTDLVAALNKYRIVGKKRAELLACDWVTGEYVHASVEFAKAEGRGEYAIGMAITRMLDQVEQPTRHDNGHIENCKCAECVIDEPSGTPDSYASLIKYQSEDHDEHEGFCVWQGELDEVFESGPYQGQHKRTPFCGKPLKSGSFRWCEEHHDINFESEEA